MQQPRLGSITLSYAPLQKPFFIAPSSFTIVAAAVVVVVVVVVVDVCISIALSSYERCDVDYDCA